MLNLTCMAEFFSRRILNILAEILLSTEFNITATDSRFGRFLVQEICHYWNFMQHLQLKKCQS